jgi:hypothetical protein
VRTKYDIVPEDISELDLFTTINQAYFLCLLGNVVFPNKFKTIPAMYIPLLNLERINNYVWSNCSPQTFNEENKGIENLKFV